MAKPKLNQEQRITLAQLQAIDYTYTGLKTSFEMAKLEAKASKTRYDALASEIDDLTADIEEEEDEARRQALRVEVSKKKKELEELEVDTIAKQATKSQLKLNIDRSIEDMKELPGVRDAIQELVAKRYDKEIKRLGKEQEKEVKDKENLEKITELVDEDKTDNAQDISDSFKDMLDARNEMKKVKAEITELDERIAIATDGATRDSLNQQKADKLTELGGVQSRYQTAKTKFIAASRDADVEFEEADVDHLVAVVNDGMKRRRGRENDYNLDRVLKKQLSKTGKNIESLDAQLAEYEQGKANIDQERAQGQATPQEKIEQAVQQKQQALQEEEKLHWWNFIKKHKRKKQIEQYKQELEEQQEREQEQQPDNDRAHKAFVRELQKNSTIDAIINREMRETRDKAADVKRSYEENDRDN